MKFIELVALANKGWEKTSEIPLTDFLDKDGKIIPDPDALGDTLGLFIVRDLKDTYDSQATDKEQVAEALRAMNSASNALDDVIRELAEA